MHILFRNLIFLILIIMNIQSDIELGDISARRDMSNFVEQEQEVIQANSQVQKSRGKIIICFLASIVLSIVISGHYFSLKYDVEKSPFESQVDQRRTQEAEQILHDISCYTQGLSFINSTHLLQSCGLYGESYFHILKLDVSQKTPKLAQVFRSTVFKKKYFLEGSVFFPKNGLIYILTWTEKAVFRYNASTLALYDVIKWQSQGWGLTHNNTHLIISDGSDTIYIVDENLKILERVKVHDHFGNAVTQINELQWVKGQTLLANVYQTSQIITINLITGETVSTSNFHPLVDKQQKKNHRQVLNGIAYESGINKYLITGKKWDAFYIVDHI